MSARILTYVDASVLITASRGDNLAARLRALKVLGDRRREFLSSEFLRLETLPYAIHFKRSKEQAFLLGFFDQRVHYWVENETDLFQPAHDLIARYNLQLIDALHLSAAMMYKAEFVTVEKPTKPFHSAYSLVASLYQK